MRAHTNIVVLASTLLALTAAGAAQAPREVVWHESDPRARTFLRNGVVAKALEVDGLILAVSIVDRAHSFAVEIDADNRGATTIDIRPELVELLVTAVPSTSASTTRWSELRAVRADELSRRVKREADSEAGAIELQGFVATTTTHEPVTTIETSPNPAVMNDPSQPATITTVNTEIQVKTVPDEAARMRAMGEGAGIRASAAAESREILAGALHAGRLAPQARIAGRVYYDRDSRVEQILVRVPLGTATVIVPFRATARRSLFPLMGRKTVRFD